MPHIHLIALTGSLAVLLTACGSASDYTNASDAETAPATPYGTVWQWVSTVTPVERIEVPDPTRYTLMLSPEGTATLQIDCNRGNGSYELSANQIQFGMLASTRMACPEDSQDTLFTSQLERITTFFIRDGELFLEMPVDSGTMRFRPGQ